MNIGVTVVGLGKNGISTVRAVKASPHAGRVVGIDTNVAACRAAREALGIETETSIDAVLRDPEIRLVFISTPNANHYPVAVAALDAGKMVFTEKPMGVNLRETEDLLARVQMRSGWLGVGFELRHYSRLYARVKEILDSGEIGKLRHLNCQYSLSPFGNENERERWKHQLATAGGLFAEKLCHYIDLPRWWDGTPVRRYFITKAENVIPYYEVPDNIELTYQFASGVVSHLTFVMNAAGAGPGDLIDTRDMARQAMEGYRLSYQVICTEGALEANVFHRQLRVFHHPGKPGMKDQSALIRVESWDPSADHQYFHNTTDEKSDAVRRAAEGLPPAVDAADAAETMRLCYAFETSAAKPWQVVEWSR